MFLERNKQWQTRKWFFLEIDGLGHWEVKLESHSSLPKTLVFTQTKMGSHWQVSVAEWQIWHMLWQNSSDYCVETISGSMNGGPQRKKWDKCGVCLKGVDWPGGLPGHKASANSQQEANGLDSLRDERSKALMKLALNSPDLGWSMRTGWGGRAGKHASWVRSPGNWSRPKRSPWLRRPEWSWVSNVGERICSAHSQV